MQVPVNELVQPSVRKSLFLEALMADEPATGVRDDDAVRHPVDGRGDLRQVEERPAERPAHNVEVQVRRLALAERNFSVDADCRRVAELIRLNRLRRLRADDAREGVRVEGAVRVRDP